MSAGNPLKKVKTGDRLVIPAQAYNHFVDAALDLIARKSAWRQDSSRLESQSQTVVLVKNDSGADLPRGGVLGLNGAAFSFVENAIEFMRRVTLKGVTPVITTHRARVGVAIEPIIAGTFGKVCVSGVCLARLELGPGGLVMAYADVKNGSSAKLISRPSGFCAVLHAEPPAGGSNDTWAVVNVGAGAPFDPFPVTLSQVGGAAGTTTAPASWTYNVTDEKTGALLASAVNPVTSPHQWARPNIGNLAKATFGLARYRSSDGALSISWINETLVGEPCGSAADFVLSEDEFADMLRTGIRMGRNDRPLEVRANAVRTTRSVNVPLRAALDALRVDRYGRITFDREGHARLNRTGSEASLGAVNAARSLRASGRRRTLAPGSNGTVIVGEPPTGTEI